MFQHLLDTNIFLQLLMVVLVLHGFTSCVLVDVHAIFPDFYNFVFNQYNTAIKSVRSDNAPELVFIDFFRSKGIFFLSFLH